MSAPLARRAVLATGTATLVGLGVSLAASTSSAAAALHPDDARLIELANACEALERACDTHTAEHQGRTTDASEEIFGELCSGFSALEYEIAATPAATIVGVLAKARAAQLPTMRTFDDCAFGLSIADDLVRLHAAGGAS